MKIRSLGALALALIISLSVWGAAVWVGSSYIETFQNGFLFGNFNILKVENLVPEFEDASGNVKRLDDRSKQIIAQEDFESDINSADFLCGSGLSITNETTAPIAGIVSIDIDQGGSAAASGVLCDSQALVLSDKAQGKFVGLCFYTMWDGNDNEMAVNVVDNTNSVELAQVAIRASSNPLEHCAYFNTATDTASIDYDIEVLTGNNNTTLRIDDLEVKVDPLTPTDVYASSEWESYTPVFQGIGTPSLVAIEWMRSGSNMKIRGTFTTGTTTGTLFRLGLPNGLTVGGETALVVPTGRLLRVSNSNTYFHFLATKGDSFIELGRSDRTVSTVQTSPVTGGAVFGTGEAQTFWLEVPIAGWTDSAQGVVVMGRTDSSSMENDFDARIANNGTASIISDTMSFLTPTRTAIGRVTLTFNSGLFSQAPKIDLTLANGAVALGSINYTNLTATSVDVLTVNNDGAYADFNFNVGLVKQGTDYIKETERTMVFPNGLDQPTCYVKDVKINDSAGGTFTSGAWRTRDINTLEGDCYFLSLSSNQLTLDSGKYTIEGYGPAYFVNIHKTKVRNITDSVDSIIGGTARGDDASSSVAMPTNSPFKGVLNISVAKVFEIQHRCSRTQSTSGFGLASNFGVSEVYTQLKITKVR